MPLRGYVIGVIILLALLAATTVLGAGIGVLIASFSDSDVGHPIGIAIGGFLGFVSGVGMCLALIEFAVEFVQNRNSREGSKE